MRTRAVPRRRSSSPPSPVNSVPGARCRRFLSKSNRLPPAVIAEGDPSNLLPHSVEIPGSRWLVEERIWKGEREPPPTRCSHWSRNRRKAAKYDQFTLLAFVRMCADNPKDIREAKSSWNEWNANSVPRRDRRMAEDQLYISCECGMGWLERGKVDVDASKSSSSMGTTLHRVLPRRQRVPVAGR